MQFILGLLFITLPLWEGAVFPFVKIVMDGLVRISDEIRDYLNKR